MRIFCLLTTAILSIQASAQTFRNYRLCVSAGAQVMPLFFIGKEPFKNNLLESVKPTLQIELPVSAGFSLALRTTRQFQRYTVTGKPEIEGFRFEDEKGFSSKVNGSFSATEIQGRLYNTERGYMAPWGRYIYYGFFWGSRRAVFQTTQFNMKDIYGNTVVTTLEPDSKKSPRYYGLSLGYGKKRYINHKKRAFIETGLSYMLLFNTFEFNSYLGSSLYGNMETISTRKFQSTSYFNFSFLYGVSF
ncbi:MAG: hypothetical protein JNL57_08805 [Bacteroidetes bacterium]|nr:hypothetical protein [Bacteroidota bacterium]